MHTPLASGKTASTLTVPVVEGFFLDPDDRRLFATYHLPMGGEGRVLTLICPPFFLDYARTHLALRKLAIALADRGQHVLRFDYQGTGDSFGDLEEATLGRWVEDIVLAVREGCDLSGCDVVQLLGVRGSALLTCQAAIRVGDLRRLALWDPVLDGRAYLAALRRLQGGWLERNPYLGQAERRAGTDGYAGYRLSERMVAEFEAFDIAACAAVPMDRLRIVSTRPDEVFPMPGVQRTITRFACQWEEDSEDLLVPGPVLEQLIECLTAP